MMINDTQLNNSRIVYENNFVSKTHNSFSFSYILRPDHDYWLYIEIKM